MTSPQTPAPTSAESTDATPQEAGPQEAGPHETGNGEQEGAWRIGMIFLALGCRAFGGPTAHVALFRDEFVGRRGWLDDGRFADLMALTQFLPGPASSQLGMLLGYRRGGLAGLLTAFLGFTLPSAVLMTLAGWGIVQFSGPSMHGIIHGLMVAVVAIVTKAILDMSPKLCPTPRHMLIALLAAAAMLLLPAAWSAWGQVGVILLAAAVAPLLLPQQQRATRAIDSQAAAKPWGKRAFITLTIFTGLFLLSLIPSSQPLWQLTSAMIRTGSMVFGGGHVVLPVLQSAVVDPGIVNEAHFLAGYGLAQAVPGPMFTLATFLGASSGIAPILLTAVVATLALFFPGMLLAAGLLPAWDRLRNLPAATAPLAGIGAAVLGLLLAAWYQPVFTKAVMNPTDMALVLVAWAIIGPLKLPSWVPVMLLGGIGAALAV